MTGLVKYAQCSIKDWIDQNLHKTIIREIGNNTGNKGFLTKIASMWTSSTIPHHFWVFSPPHALVTAS